MSKNNKKYVKDGGIPPKQPKNELGKIPSNTPKKSPIVKLPKEKIPKEKPPKNNIKL